MSIAPAKSACREGASGSKQSLVVFAPYPPSKSGIAAYVSELMPFHLAEFDVTLVIADDAVAPPEGRQTPRVLLASEFRKHRRFFEAAPKLFHVGNNPDHCYMLDLLAHDPGVVVLHDFNLNYMHEVASLTWNERQGSFSALELEYGSLGADWIRSRFERRDRGLFATYELPLNGDVLEASAGVITHSRYVQYKVAARVPSKPVWYVPHHLSPAAARFIQMSQSEARRDLALPDNELIITAPGFITYAKRISILVTALAALRGRIPPFRLVLAGERCLGQYDVDADIQAAGMKDLAYCTGYLEDAKFFKHLVACDIVANLRHPSGGETSGTLIRALGVGAPTIVFDDGPMGEFPDAVVCKIPWDARTEAALISALYELISDKVRRLELGARAAAFARDVHGIEQSAQRYGEIIRSLRHSGTAPAAEPLRQTFPHPKAVAHRFRQMAGDEALRPAKGQVIDGNLWWRCAKAPLGEAGRRALVLAAHPESTSKHFASLFEWRESDVTAMTLDAFLASSLRDHSGAPILQSTFDFALVIAPIKLPELRAAALMRRLSAALIQGGAITLELWSLLEAEFEDAPLSEHRVIGRLTDAGFSDAAAVPIQEAFFAAPFARPQGEDSSRLRFACFTARKASNFALWRFAEELEGTPLCFGGRIG